MTFSIRWLLAVVGIAALFAAALTYHSSWCATAILSLTIAMLAAATLSVRLKRGLTEFWLPFAFVGWLYLAMAFAPDTMRLSSRLPGTQVSLLIWNWLAIEPTAEDERIGMFDFSLAIGNVVLTSPSELTADLDLTFPDFMGFLDIMQCLFALLFAVIAGVCSSVLLRRKPKD